MPRIPMVRPEVPEAANRSDYLSRVGQILSTGNLTNGGFVADFEAAVAAKLDVRNCVAVSSCTSGLMLCLRALRLSGEVILPSFTFTATGQALLWAGLKPVFVDCDPTSFLIDPVAVRAAVTSQTSAILAVHVFGNPGPVEELEAIANQHRLRLIYDSAHAIGASIDGRPIGSFGDAEVFSLSPTKLLVAAEGGLITTNNDGLAATLRTARNYGNAESYDPRMLGLSSRMNEMSAALGLSGLDGLSQRVQRRNEVACQYRERLGDVPGLTVQSVTRGSISTWKDFSLLVDPERFGATRDEIRERTKTVFESRSYFDPPLHRQSIFGPVTKAKLPATEQISDRVVSLPIYSRLSSADVDRIAQTVLASSRRADARTAVAS